MEKKRKLPARAAAREQVAKKRNLTPQRSLTPAPAPAPEPEPAPVEEPPLPKSITAGKPLPTVETPQSDDLPNKEYQTIAESGVLADSLTRSRQKWISEGIFEKYWSKPTKRKGVVIEDANNPAKESMARLGQVTITVEPHVFEATMYGVKDPKPPPTQPATTFRPVMQYGPPNGLMPPPPTSKPSPPEVTAASSPASAPAQPAAQATAQTPVQTPAQTPKLTPTQAIVKPQTAAPQMQPPPSNTLPAQDISRPASIGVTTTPRPPIASPRGMESVLNTVAQQPLQRQPLPPPPPSTMPTTTPTGMFGTPPAPATRPAGAAFTANPPKPPANGAPMAAPAAPAKPAPGTDPIILTLAEKAGEDPQLRDLMKRVAQGDAQKHELEQFQAIIDRITAESKRKGTPVGPSADRLLVDGRTVRYFADEVRAILDIVLSSNPRQTSADLRPPAGSDPLVVALVKSALDDVKIRDMVRRIAENKPLFSDATDLKGVLDRLRIKLTKEKAALLKAQSPQPAASPVVAQATAPIMATATAITKVNGTPNGNASVSSPVATTPSTSLATTLPQPTPSQQNLRSKGPPPPPKPDYTAIVLEFAGGTGDRYLFPKFSIVESVPIPSGQQVIASFLIVRKGSKSEYPVADPDLDYYQPVTVRFFAPSGKHLENLARVVAPEEEVRRYMDDVMDKMTRAEYILLAMRLPRGEPKDEGGVDEKEKEKEVQMNGAASKPAQVEMEGVRKTPQPGVLWTTTSKPPKPEIRELPPRSRMYSRVRDEDDQYQTFISSVSRKETKEA
ncbi:hypothetical protein B0T25DRAFT_281838 [Lasiosphaeria hispida]|uniref:SWR1-complex protein 3 domain-containing protein n=1 Tax=Lasiosphaeria hispida TaxID=260671 RepID=A0AAJ0HBK7_9PEZI|nr:hypothetical protein B0T25DRAFT_281838 [Lasiosphaeria hispida]